MEGDGVERTDIGSATELVGIAAGIDVRLCSYVSPDDGLI
jgi:hypothetical protein